MLQEHLSLWCLLFILIMCKNVPFNSVKSVLCLTQTLSTSIHSKKEKSFSEDVKGDTDK